LSAGEVRKIGHNMPALYDISPGPQYTAEQGSYFGLIERKNFFNVTSQDFDYSQTKSYLVDSLGLNSNGFDQMEQLHTVDFDRFDVRDKGVDAYNIIGCGSGTIGYIAERHSSPTAPLYDGYTASYTAGDGTVPQASA